MKKFISIVVSFIIVSSPIHALTFTSIVTGNWSDGTTWDQGGDIPGSSDDVLIATGHIVTINDTQLCDLLTIEAGAELLVQVGADISTGSTLKVQGTLTMSGGFINAGNSAADYLFINGGVLNFSAGMINCSGRYKQNLASTASLSGSGIINVSTSGVQSASTINNFSVSNGTFAVASGATVQIILKNGNSTYKEAIYYSPLVSNFDGGSLIIENESGLSDIYIDSDMPLYKIVSRVGLDKTLHFDPDCDFSASELIVTNGEVQIDVGSQLSVTSNLNSNNSLILESDASGNASLIASGVINGSTTVQRYVEAYTGDSDGWHLISSPVTNFLIDGSDFDPGSNDDFFAWYEGSNMWLNHKVGANNITNFVDGEGFLVAYESTSTRKFVGTLNNSDISFSNLSFGDGGGWQLLGNPYSSSIQWNNGDWNLNNISGVAKVWSESSGNYQDISANGYIPSTNGFFIQVASSSNSLLIPATARTHSTSNNYKSTTDTLLETLAIVVTGDQNSYNDKCVIGFKENATEYWDIEFDSRKLHGAESAPQMWTEVMGENMSSNYLPKMSEPYVLPLSFKCGVDGYYVLKFKNLEFFNSNTSIFLEDKFKGGFEEVTDNLIYQFESKISEPNERFLLYFYNTLGVVNTTIEDQGIYSNGHNIYIKVSNHEVVDGNIKIYNVLGQLMHRSNVQINGIHKINTLLKPGCYIICFQSGSRHISTKIIINQ